MAEWTPEKEAQLAGLVADFGTRDWGRIAAAMQESPGACRSKWQRLGVKPPVGTPPASADIPPTLESEPSPQPVDLPVFLAERNVDLSVWEVDRHVFNEWGEWPRLNYQLKVWLKRKPGATLEQLRHDLLADIRAEAALKPRITHRIRPTDDEAHALCVDIFDLHLGKLAHSEEVQENYDAKIAVACAEDALRDLLAQARAYPLEEIILPLGNDFFQSDNLIGTTTGGTRQDVDTRFHLMFRRGRALATWMIEECAKLAPVYVPVVPGNHDRQTTFTLGEVLDATFSRDPRVTIDNSARPRKAHAYGKNLIAFAHGDEEKPADLPEPLATEFPELWAQCPYREFHIGHFHHGKEKAPLIVDDKRSVTVRWIRSLSGADRWHTGRGYLGRRGAEAFVYRKTGGLRAHLFTYPEAAAA